MNNAVLIFSKQQVIWLKDIIRADINDWQNMAARPIDEVGIKFSHLATTRIENMQNMLTKFEAIDAIQALQKIREKGLIPEIVCNASDILAVVLSDRHSTCKLSKINTSTHIPQLYRIYP